MQPGVRVLTGGDGQRYSFDAGTLCLELLLTGGPDLYARWEVLTGADAPATLAEWVVQSRLALGGPLAVDDLRIGPSDVTRIRHLRDTLWSIAPALAANERPAPADLEVVNGYADAPPRPRIDPPTGRPEWVTPVTGRQILGAVARDALAVIASRGRVRQCAADNCYLVFLDTSRPGSRRWCSMERCGNRAKVRAHRTRATSAP